MLLPRSAYHLEKFASLFCHMGDPWIDFNLASYNRQYGALLCIKVTVFSQPVLFSILNHYLFLKKTERPFATAIFYCHSSWTVEKPSYNRSLDLGMIASCTSRTLSRTAMPDILVLLSRVQSFRSGRQHRYIHWQLLCEWARVFFWRVSRFLPCQNAWVGC